MNAFSRPEAIDNPECQPPASSSTPMANDLALGLQFCRANAMSLTRLQLALKTGDRQCALETMDKLHALDAEMERLVRRLPAPTGEEPQWEAINRHLSDQKMAIAFQKLAFASGIEGPDLVSRPAGFERGEEADRNEFPDWPELPEMEPERLDRFPWQKAAIAILAVLIVAAIAFAASFAAAT